MPDIPNKFQVQAFCDTVSGALLPGFQPNQNFQNQACVNRLDLLSTIQALPGLELRDRVSEVESKASSKNVELDFKVDSIQLANHTLRNVSLDRWINGPDAQVVAFQNRAWQLDPVAYQYLQAHDLEGAIVSNHTPGASPEELRAWSLLDTMQHDPTFRPILEQTLQTKEKVKAEWEESLEKTQAYLEGLTGLNLDKNLDLYITHPSQKNGHARPDSNSIFWTDRADFPNYNIVFLWHEVLHHFIPTQYVGRDNFDIAHATIELLADNQLRAELNGVDIEPLQQGHEELRKGEEYLLPSWRNYVNASGAKDIFKFIDQGIPTIKQMPKP